MRKEAKLLLNKAIDSLILSIEHFNRPSDCGRTTAVLILLDHAFEMFLKAAIVQRGGRIWPRGANQTIGFDECVRKAYSTRRIKFLSNDQVFQIRAINTLRDAAQHYLLDVSEQQLYLHAQSGVTLFRELMLAVFGKDLQTDLPNRVLPLSTAAPSDILALFDTEVSEISRLLQPPHRRRLEAEAKLRALAIVDRAVFGNTAQPSDSDLSELVTALQQGAQWSDVFRGVALLNVEAEGTGPSIDLRITKNEGIPVHLVPEGTEGAVVVGAKRVDELGFYNLSLHQLAEKLGMTAPKTTALVRYLNMQGDSQYCKTFQIGGMRITRYSQLAIHGARQALETTSIDEIWKTHQPKTRRIRV